MMKYPNKIKKNNIKNTEFGNRGMSLEYDLNTTNDYYLEKNIAIVHKKPTPIKVVNVEYKNKDHKITEAYFEKQSTTDYNGIYNGKYIDFEAKEVNGKNFPIRNIHKHQLEHIFNVINKGGISFIIVRFKTINETYYLDGIVLKNYLDNNSKSYIPLDYFIESGFLIKENYNIRVNYIKIIDEIYFGGQK